MCRFDLLDCRLIQIDDRSILLMGDLMLQMRRFDLFNRSSNLQNDVLNVLDDGSIRFDNRSIFQGLHAMFQMSRFGLLDDGLIQFDDRLIFQM